MEAETAPRAPVDSSLWAPRAPYLPWLIFAVGLLIRLWGIGWGLPNEGRHWSYHPDEPILYIYSQQVEPTRLDFEPGFYNYGTLYLTLLRVAGDVAKTYGGGDQLWQQAGSAHLAGRLISALAGAGTALVLFWIIRRRLGVPAALFGSLTVALAPGFVVHSRFQTVDVLATFLLAVSALFALKLLSPGATDEPALDGRLAFRAALLSGLFAGLSAGTKYTGFLGLATLFVVLALSGQADRRKLALGGAGAAVLVFLITTPGAVLNFQAFWRDFQFEMQHSSQGHGLVFAGLPSGFVWHVYNLFLGVGPILVGLGLIGLAAGMIRRDPAALAVGAFFVLYYILIGRAEVLFLRYTFPLLIGLAYGLGWLVSNALAGPGWKRAVPALGIVGLGGLLGGGFASTAVYSLQMAAKDPRDQALDHLRSSGAKTVGVVADPWFYSPPYYPEVGAPRAMPIEARLEAMAKSEDPRVVRALPAGDPAQRYDWNTELLDLAPETIVFSSFETEGLDRIRNRTDLGETEALLRDRFVAFSERLVNEYRLERRIGGFGTGGQSATSGVHDLDYIRPLIWVWKRKAP